MSDSSRTKLVLRTITFLLAPIVVAVLLKTRPQETPLPSLGKVEPFTLTERSGKIMAQNNLEGKIWVADFIFTSCPGPCLRLSTQFAAFQKELATLPDVRLVSFSVDPNGDTPEVLTRYATRFGADPQRWLFLTGEKTKVYTLIENSFRLAVQENYDLNAPPDEKFIHSTRVVLVDRTGVIRGYYDGLDPTQYPKLKADIQRLLKERSS